MAWILTAGAVAPTSHRPGEPAQHSGGSGWQEEVPDSQSLVRGPPDGLPHSSGHPHTGSPYSPRPGTPLLGEVWLQMVWKKKQTKKSKTQSDHYYLPLKKVLFF